MSNIVIVGAGGFGLEVAAYAEDMVKAGGSEFGIKGFLDDTKPTSAKHAGYPILGGTDSAIDSDCIYVVAVGAPGRRKALAEKLASKGARFVNITHPTAYIARSAEIGPGTVIAPFAFVGPKAQVGNHCTLNIYASAGHESSVGHYCVLSPYATIHGSAVLDTGVFMGSHACVTAKMRVGNGSSIASGSVVYQKIQAGAHVIGNPAAFRKV